MKGRESQITEENKEVLFRRAVPSEKAALQKLQIDVFSGEQGIPPEEVPVLPSLAPQYWCAVKGSVPIGAVAAWREEGKIHWGRFAVKKEYRGSISVRSWRCTPCGICFPSRWIPFILGHGMQR